MLKQLTLSNFRLFDDEVTIHFRPITVLIGRNNTGKSSIIKFLLMLQQSLGLDRPSFLVSQDKKVDLGNFYNLRNKSFRSSDLSFSLTIEGDGSSKDALSLFLLREGNNPHGSNMLYTVESVIAYDKDNSFQGKDHRITLTLNEKKVLERFKSIYQDSRFLDFSDEQQKEFGEQKTGNDIAKLNAENSCIETLSDYINRISYISPVKKYLPHEFSVIKNIPIKYVGAKGTHTLQHLFQQHLPENMNQYEFIRPHIGNILDIKNIEFNSLGNLAECQAQNVETGQTVNVADFGFGVSQCLPILVQGAMMNPHTSLMVEQPEAQIHPTAQLELGSFFADLWKDKKVGSIIETHSNNILLRLQKLVATGKLNKEYVSVVFFDTKVGKPVVRNLVINQDGNIRNMDADSDIVEGLPMEFFGADIMEGLELGAAKFKYRGE